eukprot:751357-Hanusia_phi.AAC.3
MKTIEAAVDGNEDIDEEDSILLQHIAMENSELRTRLAELEGVKQRAIGKTVRLRERLAELAEEEIKMKGRRGLSLHQAEGEGREGGRAAKEGKEEREKGVAGEIKDGSSWISSFVQARLPTLSRFRPSSLSRRMKELRTEGLASMTPWWNGEQSRKPKSATGDGDQAQEQRLDDILSSLQDLLGHETNSWSQEVNGSVAGGGGGPPVVDEEHFVCAIAQLRLYLCSKVVTEDMIALSVDSLCVMEQAMGEGACSTPLSSCSCSSSSSFPSAYLSGTP